MRKVVIASPVATQSGYGHHAREIITNFIEQRGNEWDIKLVSLPWGHTPMTYPISTDLQLRIVPLPLTEQPDVWIQITVPNEFQAVGKLNIGITAGTEGDVCPESWIDNLNSMQLVIVPSEFTKNVFENTARTKGKLLTTPIEVIPEYFDETVYSTKSLSATNAKNMLPQLDEISESFAFLAVGHWLTGAIGQDRKNLSGLIHCFFDTYKNTKSAPALILKTSGATYSTMDRLEIENKINQIRDIFGTAKLPNVYLLHGELTDDEMNALYNHPKVKAMISFTKAEGFGRPLLEFSTTGKPIIAPHYSGQADFLKKDFICEIPGGLTPIHPSAQNDFLIGEAKWFSPDYAYAEKLIKEVEKNYKKWCDLAKRQRYFVNSTFSKTAVKTTYESVLSKVDVLVDRLPKPVQLQLPKLKKLELPKLQKVGE
jgi:glycosyltransferase involved in cell wall biosynthesis